MFSPDDKRIVWPIKMESYHRQVVIRDAKNRELVIVSEWRPSIEAFKAKHDWAKLFVELANRNHLQSMETVEVPIEDKVPYVKNTVNVYEGFKDNEPLSVPVDPKGDQVSVNGDGNHLGQVVAKKRGRPFGSKNK